MFGFGKPKESPGQAALAGMTGGAGSSGGSSGDKDKKGEAYRGSGFDPTGLERAAKAAKQLDQSKWAGQALDIIKMQEQTEQMNYQSKVAEYQAYAKQSEIKRVAEEGQEARRTLEAQTEHDKRRAQYRDQLERKRHVDEMNAQKYMREEEVRRQEENVRRQEAIKRKTLEYEAELRQKTELARVEAETRGRIRQERENHDLRVEQARVEAEEYRNTVLESIKLAGETVGGGIKLFLSDNEKMVAAVGTLSAMALGIYTAKVSTGVLGRFIEARLGKPSLVRETSRTSVLAALRRPLHSTATLAQRLLRGRKQPHDALTGVVLDPRLEERLRMVATSTFNTKKNQAPFRHLLLHGPPGTGKTLFAKGLAKHSGLEYAILTGGDVAPLGRDAVTEIHKLFDWANASNKGLLLFVDEADAFLRRRSVEHISEDLRNALNAFLYRTGEATGKFMLVYASNQPDQFDWAINDRIDEMVEFQLPGLEERKRMVSLYMKKYLLDQQDAAKGRAITVEDIEDNHIDEAAKATEHFSGREIAKLAIAWQAAAYGSVDATFNPSIMRSVLEVHCLQKAQKEAWLKKSGGAKSFAEDALIKDIEN